MKYLDCIEVTTNAYENKGIFKGTKGVIVLSEIRNNTFECELFGVPDEVRLFAIDINHMKVVKSSNVTNKEILKDLPKNDPHWWCKVEDGYILNLLGEKKNKIQYNYDS